MLLSSRAPSAARHASPACRGVAAALPSRRATQAASGAAAAAAAAAALPLPAMAPRRRADVSASAAAAENFSGDMLEPSAANKLPVRAAALAAAVTAAAYFGAPALQPAAASFAHLLAVGIFLGTSFYVSFIAGIVMFKNLPRQTFGRLQSKLFPLYFGLLTACAGVAFATLAASTPGGAQAITASFGGRALLAAVAGSLANALFLEPRATEIMFERYALENKVAAGGSRSEEDAAKTKALGKRFGALHGASSMANLVALCAMVAYTWQLAGRLALGV